MGKIWSGGRSKLIIKINEESAALESLNFCENEIITPNAAPRLIEESGYNGFSKFSFSDWLGAEEKIIMVIDFEASA